MVVGANISTTLSAALQPRPFADAGVCSCIHENSLPELMVVGANSNNGMSLGIIQVVGANSNNGKSPRIMKRRFQTLPRGHMKKSMLRFGVLISLFAGLMTLSCKKDDRVELFELTYPPPPIEFDILPGLNTFDTHIYSFSPIPTRYLERLAASGHSADEVIAIEAKDAALSSLFGDENINFINRVSIYIFDPFEPANKVEFLYLEPIPYKEKNTIRLFPGITDISDWIKEEYIGIEIRLNFREISPALTEMTLRFDLRVMGN